MHSPQLTRSTLHLALFQGPFELERSASGRESPTYKLEDKEASGAFGGHAATVYPQTKGFSFQLKY